MKHCRGCGELKPLYDFYPVTSQFVKKDGTRSVYRMSNCKSCNLQRTLQYQKNNKEKVNARNARWREKNRESARALVRNWGIRNKDKKKEQVKGWKVVNRHRLTEAERNRQIRKLQATPSWTDREAMTEVYEKAASLSLTTGIKHHVDHIVPIISKIVCGLHVPANLQVLPAIENIKKSNRFIPS